MSQPPNLAKSTSESSVDVPAEPSIGQLTKTATEHLSTLIRGEVELAKAEVGQAVKNAGTGSIMFIGAAIVLVFSLTFGFIALAEGIIAAGLWRWAGYLVVFVFFLLVAALLVYLGIRKVKKIKAPERTIEEAKETVAVLRHPSQARSTT